MFVQWSVFILILIYYGFEVVFDCGICREKNYYCYVRNVCKYLLIYLLHTRYECTILSSVACSSLHHFSTLSHRRGGVGEGHISEHKMSFDFV